MSTRKSGRNNGGKLPCGNLSRIVNGFTKRTGRIYRRTQTMNKRIRKKQQKQREQRKPVSYTHLTLPTNREV